ncbi:MAG: hypothetical protein JSU82_17355 [Rhodospirillales bacterium]|nr:MAG: hypothetical protein JSU82_17355 [Rhodospirillales bacterium]
MLPETATSGVSAHERRETVRAAVRGLLEQNPEFARVDPGSRRKLAHDLVQLTETSLALMAEEAEADPDAAAARTPLAGGMAFDPAANRQLAGVAQATLEGIAFPRFVTELVNGVFKGLIDANAQQIQAYVDMISGVTAASADSGSATGPAQARLWLVQQFPDSYELGVSQDDWGQEEANGTTVVRLREGRDGPPREDVAALLELTGEEAEGFDTEEPEEGLLGKVRAYLSRKRQKVMASLLMLGINRLVIDHGRIKAGMNFSIDAHSAAEENRARRFEFAHSSTAGASVGFGPWSVNASMTNSIGIVNTSQSHQREEMNQAVNMNADVELHFHSDYMPLNQLAAADSVQRIRAVSANPTAPATAPGAGRAPETPGQTAARSVVTTPITRPSPGTPPPVRRDGGSGRTPPATPPTTPATPRTTTPATRPATTPATRPATTPATRPATTPATRPATTPATRPATTPATPPATTPATRPATTPATPPATSPATPPR